MKKVTHCLETHLRKDFNLRSGHTPDRRPGLFIGDAVASNLKFAREF